MYDVSIEQIGLQLYMRPRCLVRLTSIMQGRWHSAKPEKDTPILRALERSSKRLQTRVASQLHARARATPVTWFEPAPDA